MSLLASTNVAESNLREAEALALLMAEVLADDTPTEVGLIAIAALSAGFIRDRSPDLSNAKAILYKLSGLTARMLELSCEERRHMF
jgi:hypothetical protein